MHYDPRAEKEVDGEPITTGRGFYYVSKTRKHGKNALWVGPFATRDECWEDAAEFVKRTEEPQC